MNLWAQGAITGASIVFVVAYSKLTVDLSHDFSGGTQGHAESGTVTNKHACSELSGIVSSMNNYFAEQAEGGISPSKMSIECTEGGEITINVAKPIVEERSAALNVPTQTLSLL